MTIITELADGRSEVFESENYLLSKVIDFHPILCKVTVYSNGHKIKVVKRPFKFIYKNFIFKSAKVQKKLEELNELKEQLEKPNDEK